MIYLLTKVLANAQGFIAIPFVVNIGTSAPPSVRLIPCRPYAGAPIGTTYEVQLFTGIIPIIYDKCISRLNIFKRIQKYKPKIIV